MSGVNKVLIVGHLGRDPEIRQTESGDAVSTLSVATSEVWRDKQSGEKRERTEWHRIILWGKQAETAEQYLQKGSLAAFEGSLQTRKWQDQHGVDKYTTEIKCFRLTLLSSNSANGQGRQEDDRGSHSNNGGVDTQERSLPADLDDEIPF